MTAPESVVRAVMETEGCCVEEARVWNDDLTLLEPRPYCREHRVVALGEVCPSARIHADAAFAASLEWAAERLDEGDEHFMALRRWAGAQ